MNIGSHIFGRPAAGVSSPEPDMGAACAHLEWWFGPALADPQAPNRIVLSTICRGRYDRSKEFDAVGPAADWAVGQARHSDLYLHLALHMPKGPERLTTRGVIDSAVCLPGLAVDLDAASPHRSSNQGHAPDLDSLHDLVTDFEERYGPGLTMVGSGCGLHVYGRFREPLWLLSRSDREAADRLLKRFASGFRILAIKRGWPSSVDTCGLATLLRISGTLNHKGQLPVLVRTCSPPGVSAA